jgi:lysophospholipase L1-like esterase
LYRHGLPFDPPIIIARTGWTAAELHAGVRSASLENDYELVSLQIGVNDQYRGYSVSSYRREFGILLGQAIKFAGSDPGRVMVLSIPDWGVTPFAQGRDQRRVAADIDQFNLANLVETHAAGAHYIDVTPASRLAGGNASLLAPDGLHPAGEMYTIWVELILPVALRILEATPLFGGEGYEF